MRRSTLIDLSPAKLICYPFMISLNRCNGSCNIGDDWSKKVCVPNETKDVNVKVFNMITRIKKAKPRMEHILCDSKCKLDSSKCNSNQKCKK